jgi:hypothetical protein
VTAQCKVILLDFVETDAVMKALFSVIIIPNVMITNVSMNAQGKVIPGDTVKTNAVMMMNN